MDVQDCCVPPAAIHQVAACVIELEWTLLLDCEMQCISKAASAQHTWRVDEQSAGYRSLINPKTILKCACRYAERASCQRRLPWCMCCARPSGMRLRWLRFAPLYCSLPTCLAYWASLCIKCCFRSGVFALYCVILLVQVAASILVI